MRILLLSDIHANIVALEAVLSSTPYYDAVWCLGDVVGYGPAPNECVARMRGLNALALMGNHDRAVIGELPLPLFAKSARAALEWTMQVLSTESGLWLGAHPSLQVLPDYGVTLVHASPRDSTFEYIENSEIALASFPLFDTPFCFYGHTHRPLAYRLLARERILRVESLPEHQPYLVQPKLLLNPGSVGQPRDGDPRAAFAIYDTDTQILTPYRVAYDVSTTQRAMRDVGLPQSLIDRLAVGA